MNIAGELDPVLEEIIARWDIPGMAVGIVDGSEIIYARGFGVQSLAAPAPVTPDSIFCVASISKCFVSTAVMQLAGQGKLHIDAPLVQYLPFFKLDDDRFDQITIRQMLSHTSGMPDMDEDAYDELVYHPELDEGAAERYVRGLRSLKMIAAPGERFAYSNIAYNVLGCLISALSGQTFEDYMKQRVLLPAGMRDSTFYFPEVERERLAVPHLRVPEMIPNPHYPYHRADAPASFLHSTAMDMCRWCAACLNRGAAPGGRILPSRTYDQMWTPAARWGYPPFYEDTGLGWTLGHYDGVKTVSHGGMGFGWSDFLILLPEINRGAILLCGEESFARGRTVRALVNAMLGRTPQAGDVSWMIPVSRAWIAGGIREVRARYETIKPAGGENDASDGDDLLNLAYQMASAGKPEQAVQALELNLCAFPEHRETHHFLVKTLIGLPRLDLAEPALLRALALFPEDEDFNGLLDQIHSARPASPAA